MKADSLLKGPLAAHYVADLPQGLSPEQMALPGVRDHLDTVRRHLLQLLSTSVFPHKVREHTDPGALPLLRESPPEKLLGVVSHREVSSLGKSPEPLTERLRHALRLRGRIDGPDILRSAIAIENTLRGGLHRLISDQAFAGDIPIPPDATENMPVRRYVCCDMDGVLATLRHVPGTEGPVGFRDTLLGCAVQDNAERFEGELLRGSHRRRSGCE